MKTPLRFRLNGKAVELTVEPHRRLLWVLRSDLGLVGTKYGCGQGLCGACTVLVDRTAKRSCQLPVRRVEGREVTTIEGLAGPRGLHPVQKAFVEHGAVQCGFCTPGMILSACGLLQEKPAPTRQEIIGKMEGNLCRCGTYARVIQAIETASVEMKGERR